jgi:hypothetical protein
MAASELRLLSSFRLILFFAGNQRSQLAVPAAMSRGFMPKGRVFAPKTLVFTPKSGFFAAWALLISSCIWAGYSIFLNRFDWPL